MDIIGSFIVYLKTKEIYEDTANMLKKDLLFQIMS